MHPVGKKLIPIHPVGEHNWPILASTVTSTVTVSDSATKSAMRWMYEHHGLVTEPSGEGREEMDRVCMYVYVSICACMYACYVYVCMYMCMCIHLHMNYSYSCSCIYRNCYGMGPCLHTLGLYALKQFI